MANAAAQALSLPVDDSLSPPNARTSISPAGWRGLSPAQSIISERPRTAIGRWTRSARRMRNKSTSLFFSLTPLQRVALLLVNVILITSIVLFLVYNEQIFAFIRPIAKSWRELPGGWLILFFLTIVVSFPPVIGYSSCVTIAGFVWGMKGWFIVAAGSIIGSTLAFVVSRTILKGFVSRLTDKNKRFAALALVLKHDGLKLLTMIRLCPLPYSLSNGAISTIPTVTWYNFMLATAIVSPKLLLHVFIGAEIGKLAEHGGKMDGKTKAISYISITIGILLGISVGYFIYVRTRARAIELEAEEIAAAAEEGRRSEDGHLPGYADDPAEREAVEVLRSNPDDVSLHTAYADDDAVETGYRDEFTDDEDAQERDVFDIGDGDTDNDEDDKADKSR